MMRVANSATPRYEFSFHDLRATYGLNMVDAMTAKRGRSTRGALDQLRELMWQRTIGYDRALPPRFTARNRKLFDAVQDGWSAHLSTLVTRNPSTTPRWQHEPPVRGSAHCRSRRARRFLHPERAPCSGGKAIDGRADIGQICYLKRDTSRPQRSRRIFDVTQASAANAPGSYACWWRSFSRADDTWARCDRRRSHGALRAVA